MGGFLAPPTFTPPVPPIQLGTSGQVLTMVGGLPKFATGGGGGSSGYLGTRLAYASPAGASNNVAPSADWPKDSSGNPINRLAVTLPSGAANWTGLVAGGDGQILVITNFDSANTLTLNSQNAGSSAGNQFLGPADMSIPPGDSLWSYYDETSGFWVLVP